VRARLASAALIAAAVVAACGGSSPSATPSGGAGRIDPQGDWVLESGMLDGAPIAIVEGSAPTMSVDGTRIGGTSACNQYGAEILVEGDVMRFGETSSTAMLCEDDLMATEAAYVSALARVRAATMEDGALILVGDGVSLRFLPLDAPPLDAIVGRPWRLVSIIEDGVEREPGGEMATLTYAEDGSFEGSTGCRTFTGRWIESQARIFATETAMAGPDCPPDLAAQDGIIPEVAGDNAPSIDGSRLVLTGRHGGTLVYEPVPEG
jgi:heat shock protein HslJ